MCSHFCPSTDIHHVPQPHSKTNPNPPYVPLPRLHSTKAEAMAFPYCPLSP